VSFLAIGLMNDFLLKLRCLGAMKLDLFKLSVLMAYSGTTLAGKGGTG
jgi:hypothetical protein